jgi:hypothetical protein
MIDMMIEAVRVEPLDTTQMKKTKKSGRRDPLFQGEQLAVLSAKFHVLLAICCCGIDGIVGLSHDRCIEKVPTAFAHSLVHDLHELRSLSRNRKCGACGVARASDAHTA